MAISLLLPSAAVNTSIANDFNHLGVVDFTAAVHLRLMRTALQEPYVNEPQKVATKGCCFSIGYGAMMVPCCLKVTKGQTKSACTSGQSPGIVGGATGWSKKCPESAKAAAQ